MSENSNPDPQRALLRHALATLAYRAGKVLRDAPEGFSMFHADEGVRAPGQIVAHMGDLMDWALSMADGSRKWQDSKPLAWEKEVDRFFAALKKFDDYLASSADLKAPVDKLFQGPVADSLTHVGQLALLRRLAAEPISAENYFVADIVVGRVGSEQTPPKKKF